MVRVPDTAELSRLEALPILAKKVVGQGDVDIAGLIDRLEAVSKGVERLRFL